MYEGDVQSVLRCGQCNKPFDKQSTLKRHGYYCRSRRAGGSIRSRACTACARGKSRCDNRQPECSRCLIKAIKCHYPAKNPKDAAPRTQRNEALPDEIRKPSPQLGSGSRIEKEASSDGGMSLDSALGMLDPEFANLGEEYVDWNDLDINFADFLNPPQTEEKAFEYPLPGSPYSAPLPAPWLDHSVVQLPHAFSYSNPSIPPSPTHALQRSLIQRPKMKTGTQRIAKLIFYNLKSYPLMMLKHNTLPPFIHPRFITSGVESKSLEPLSNCISLVHMIGGGVQGSRKLFWKNVRLECERICEEHTTLNKWGLLAAMQALSIYILIRLDEGETENNNFDFLLLATVAAISQQLTHTGTDIDCNPQSSWEAWIFEESRRRMAVLYRVVNMLIYFDPASICTLQTDLLLAPLPAKKQLWEAGDEAVWKAESEKEPGVQTVYALAADGELVKLDEGQRYCGGKALLYKPLNSDARNSSAIVTNWEEWCSGMDGFGGLIMLAAALVE